MIVESELLKTIYTFRGIERLVIQLGAISCVVAGTFLYKWGINGNSSATGEGGGFKFSLSNAAPGSVLALFGIIIMGAGTLSPAKFNDASPIAVTENTQASNDQGKAGASSISYSNNTSAADLFLGDLQAVLVSDSAPADPVDELTKLSTRASAIVDSIPSSSVVLREFLSDVAEANTPPRQARELLRTFRERAKSIRSR